MSKARVYVWPFEWLTTVPSGRAHTHGADDGQTGWRVHCVAVGSRTRLSELRDQPALCGLIPRTGWGMDLFIEEECARCARRADLLDIEPRVARYNPPSRPWQMIAGNGWKGTYERQCWYDTNPQVGCGYDDGDL